MAAAPLPPEPDQPPKPAPQPPPHPPRPDRWAQPTRSARLKERLQKECLQKGRILNERNLTQRLQPEQDQVPQTKAPVRARVVQRALLLPAVAVAVGALLIHNSLESPADPKAPVFPLAVAPAAPGTTETAAAGQVLPRATPLRITIPEIAVNAPFTGLTIGASGQLNPPPADDTNLVGWFRDGVSPGERGSSIVVGHVDTRTGPAVFARLKNLKRGSTVNISRTDGSAAVFAVDSIDTFSKANFPDQRVYADASSAQLRLITCGGAYDHKKKDYEANVVVFAHLVATKRPSTTPPPPSN